MTGVTFAQLIRYYTKTNSSTFPDADIVLLANATKLELAQEVVKLDEDYFTIPMTRNLVASDSSDVTKREYSVPTDTIKVERVQAKLDGTNWVKLTEFDATAFKRPATEAEIKDHFGNGEGEAYYDFFRKSLWIYSGAITAGTATLEMWATIYPADISASTLASATDLSEDPSTTSFGMPLELHEIWARMISKAYKNSKDKPIPLSELELSIEADLAKALSILTPASRDTPLIGIMPSDTRLQGL